MILIKPRKIHKLNQKIQIRNKIIKIMTIVSYLDPRINKILISFINHNNLKLLIKMPILQPKREQLKN